LPNDNPLTIAGTLEPQDMETAIQAFKLIWFGACLKTDKRMSLRAESIEKTLKLSNFDTL
jgi:hypothetical protein